MSEWVTFRKKQLGAGWRTRVVTLPNATRPTRYVYFFGSDHPLDWIHHVVPFDRLREWLMARRVAKHLLTLDEQTMHYIIGGHSLGGAIAAMVTYRLRKWGYLAMGYGFGAKRVGYPWHDALNVVYVHEGDIVPKLPPWRKRYAREEVYGERETAWAAHQPSAYHDVEQRHGFR